MKPWPWLVVTAVALGASGTPQQPPTLRSAIDVVRLDVQDFTSDRALLMTAIDSFRPGWMPEMKELPGRMAQETVRSAISFLRSRPHSRNAILLIGVGGAG